MYKYINSQILKAKEPHPMQDIYKENHTSAPHSQAAQTER